MPSFYHTPHYSKPSISSLAAFDSDDDEDIRPDVETAYLLAPPIVSPLPSPRSSTIPLLYYRTPDYATWADHLTKEYEEGDDELHDPELDTQELDASGTIWTRRGVANLGGMVVALLLLIGLMMVLPIMSFHYYRNHYSATKYRYGYYESTDFAPNSTSENPLPVVTGSRPCLICGPPGT
ncbi:hypothetical protein PENSPDRAFT_649704 [Peniophora sp. CONT]|nr:hypothetical protein PENSPDRAFT_649704 [Peniophora sp. CONT]